MQKIYVFTILIVLAISCEKNNESPESDEQKQDEKPVQNEPKDSIFYHDFMPDVVLANAYSHTETDFFIELKEDPLLDSILVERNTDPCVNSSKTNGGNTTSFRITNCNLTTYDQYDEQIFPDCPYPVEQNVAINNNFYWTTSCLLYVHDECLPFTYVCGDKYSTEAKYFPFKITKGSKIHFGWMKMDLYPDSVVLRDYAYKTIPGSPVIAGQKE